MADITWKSILTKLVQGNHLTAEESEWFVDDLMKGNANPAAVGAVLATQQQLGLTADEIAGAAKAMVSHAVPLEVNRECTDIVGTGGDGAHTVNLSTMGAVIAAAAGVTIVKHGNRAASSKCGAADCLEALGLPLDLKPQAVAEVADEVGITFAFAKTFHPAMRFVGPVRAALGVPCVFNVLGPLTNPATPKHMAIGCANRAMSPIMAAVYAANGQSGMVYTSNEGLDEMAPTGPSPSGNSRTARSAKRNSTRSRSLGSPRSRLRICVVASRTTMPRPPAISSPERMCRSVRRHCSMPPPQSWRMARLSMPPLLWANGSAKPMPSPNRQSIPVVPPPCSTSGSPSQANMSTEL